MLSRLSTSSSDFLLQPRARFRTFLDVVVDDVVDVLDVVVDDVVVDDVVDVLDVICR